ncbi:MAG: hypothetical protein KC621_23065 [Myxococcales bacterium]|nr:hypothetical protein [Myxococcales bacterium]
MISLLLASQIAHAAPTLAQPTLTRGLDTTLVVTNATPGTTIYFAMSTTGTGQGPCYPALQGLCIDLTGTPVLLGTAVADGTGRAEVVAGVPHYAPLGTTVYFQAVQGGNPASKSTTRTASVQEIALGAPYCDDPGPDEKVNHLILPTTTTFENKAMRYFVPSNPQGIIFYFNGGSNAMQDVDGDEQWAFLWNLMGAYEHYAIVATERTAPGGGASWDATTAPNNNADMNRIDRLRDWMIANTAVTANTPTVLVGFSDGGIFATSFGYHADVHYNWPMKAVISNNAAARQTVPTVATQFWIAEHDDPAATGDIANMVADLQAAGTPVERVDYNERIAGEDFIMRKDWVSLDHSIETFDDLVASGILTAGGARNVPVNQIDTALSDWSANTAVGGSDVAVSRLKVMWATHRYSAFDANRMCNWIRNH